jgi:ATP-dependent DNA ligase
LPELTLIRQLHHRRRDLLRSEGRHHRLLELQAAMKAGKTAGLIFFAFNLLWLNDQDLRALPQLVERKKRLQALLAENNDQKMMQLST